MEKNSKFDAGTQKNLIYLMGIAEGFVISVREPILATILCIILYVQVGILGLPSKYTSSYDPFLQRNGTLCSNSQRTWQNLLEHSGGIGPFEVEN